MGCGCSSKSKNDEVFSKNTPKELFIKYSFKTIGFILLMVLLPLINLILIWFMFKTFVIGDSIDLIRMFENINKKIGPKNDDEEEYEDDDEDDELTDDDVILLDVDDIKIYNTQ